MIPQLISIFGPDGSGKSTHVQLLVQSLRAQGLRIKRTWIRSPHTLAFILSQIMVRLGLYRVATNPAGMMVKIPAINGNSTTRSIWALLELLSVMPLVLLRIYLPMWRGYMIVSDRSLVDTVVTIAYFIGDKDFVTGRTARLLLHLIPKCAVFIDLDSDYATILTRRGKTAEPQEFIEFQRTAYTKLSKIIAAEIIDTSRLSIEQTSERIRTMISSFPCQIRRRDNMVQLTKKCIVEEEKTRCPERIVPGHVDTDVEAEHISRYLFAREIATGKVLDLGCGAGYGTRILSEAKSDQAIGLDLDHDSLAHGVTFYSNEKTDFIQAEASMLPFKDEAFDCVVGFEVIEHVSDPTRALSELRRILKYSGRVILSTPNKLLTSPFSKKPFNPYHKTEWSTRDFLQLVQNGFRLETIYAQSWGNKFLTPARITLRHILTRYLHLNLLKKHTGRINPTRYVVTKYKPRILRSPTVVIVIARKRIST